MQTLKSLNLSWSAIVAALFAVGIVATADPYLGAISVAGMLIIALLNFVTRTFNYRISAGWLTIGLYVVSTALAFFLTPITLPPFPEFGSDPAMFAQAFADFINETAPLAGILTASATLVYNALKPIVFDRYMPAVDADTKPEKIG